MDCPSIPDDGDYEVFSIPFQWESLDSKTQRAAVIGGWIIRIKGRMDKSAALVFISDSYHRWRIE